MNGPGGDNFFIGVDVYMSLACPAHCAGAFVTVAASAIAAMLTETVVVVNEQSWTTF